MTTDLGPIDISSIPELVRIAEEVEITKKPRKLMRDRKTLAILVPVNSAPKAKNRARTKADYEAFLSAAGGWKDIDTDKLVANIYATRKRSNRSPVNL